MVDKISRNGKYYIVKILKECESKKEAEEDIRQEWKEDDPFENILDMVIGKYRYNIDYLNMDREKSIERLKKEIEKLTEREKVILISRFSNKTLEKVALENNITGERVRQIESKALRRLSLRVKYIVYNEELERLEKEYNRTVARKWRQIEAIKNTPVEHMAKKELVIRQKIEEFEFSVRTYHCLKRAGVSTTQDLLDLTQDDLMRIKNLGRKSLKEIKIKLGENNLHLKDSEEDEENEYFDEEESW